MRNLENLPVINFNDKPPITIRNLTSPYTTKSNTLYESIRKRKFMWILNGTIFIIIIIAIVITIPFVLISKETITTSTSIATTTTVLTITTGREGNNIITKNSKWKQNGTTVAGGNGPGNRLNQLSWPISMYLDEDDQIVYISDFDNHRVVAWKFNAKNGQIVAGGNGLGNKTNQLNYPTGITMDKINNSLIVCDRKNRRVMRWSCLNNTSNGDIIIPNVDCSDVEIDNNGFLYVTDEIKREVRRWTMEDNQGILVVDGNYSIYATDNINGLVRKWIAGTEESIRVAGVQNEKGNTIDRAEVYGITVDQLGNVYTAETYERRIRRWIKGDTQSSIIISEYKSKQIMFPTDLSFDKYGNLYVLEGNSGQVLKFSIDSN